MRHRERKKRGDFKLMSESVFEVVESRKHKPSGKVTKLFFFINDAETK
jgi:hypothetical protein